MKKVIALIVMLSLLTGCASFSSWSPETYRALGDFAERLNRHRI